MLFLCCTIYKIHGAHWTQSTANVFSMQIFYIGNDCTSFRSFSVRIDFNQSQRRCSMGHILIGVMANKSILKTSKKKSIPVSVLRAVHNLWFTFLMWFSLLCASLLHTHSHIEAIAHRATHAHTHKQRRNTFVSILRRHFRFYQKCECV